MDPIRKNSILFVLLVMVSSLSAQVEQMWRSDVGFEKNYTGKIGETDVAFHLKKQGNKLHGFYYEENKGLDIQLCGNIVKDGQIDISEFDYKHNITAKITGEFTDNGFTGKWKNEKTGKSYPIELKETTDRIEPLPEDFTGKYISEDGCPMQIEIIKEEYEYHYTMQTSEKKYRGPIRFSREFDINDRSQTLWIVLQDFEWAEYKGSLMDVEDPDEVPSMEMWGLDLYYAKGELMFQNYGNVMNYYVKMNECGEKYVRLLKE